VLLQLLYAAWFVCNRAQAAPIFASGVIAIVLLAFLIERIAQVRLAVCESCSEKAEEGIAVADFSIFRNEATMIVRSPDLRKLMIAKRKATPIDRNEVTAPSASRATGTTGKPQEERRACPKCGRMNLTWISQCPQCRSKLEKTI
jgi:hypothetical protein